MSLMHRNHFTAQTSGHRKVTSRKIRSHEEYQFVTVFACQMLVVLVSNSKGCLWDSVGIASQNPI